MKACKSPARFLLPPHRYVLLRGLGGFYRAIMSLAASESAPASAAAGVSGGNPPLAPPPHATTNANVVLPGDGGLWSSILDSVKSTKAVQSKQCIVVGQSAPRPPRRTSRSTRRGRSRAHAHGRGGLLCRVQARIETDALEQSCRRSACGQIVARRPAARPGRPTPSRFYNRRPARAGQGQGARSRNELPSHGRAG